MVTNSKLEILMNKKNIYRCEVKEIGIQTLKKIFPKLVYIETLCFIKRKVIYRKLRKMLQTPLIFNRLNLINLKKNHL